MKIRLLTLCLFTGIIFNGLGQTTPPLLLHSPTMSKDQLVFLYAGDLWSTEAKGGTAQRLTIHPGQEFNPRFSPDGSLLAFSGYYDGNLDVYVMSAKGGVPRRLTYHPGEDSVVGWTRDGKSVLFRSSRHSPQFNGRLFTVALTGGLEEELPLPMAEEGSYSPDGARLAYVPTFQWQASWKRYRGGQTKPIWIADLSDSSIDKLPRDNSNDYNPMWVDNTIFFLSDRQGPVTLFSYDLVTQNVQQVVTNYGLDFKTASVAPGGIIIEQFGALLFYDFATRQTKPIEVSIQADLPEVRTRFKSIAARDLEIGGLSPQGQRAVFEVRGEILTFPAEKGDVRNLTRTPGIAERNPSWSPDGQNIAYFSEESGEYGLHIQEQSGLGETRRITLCNPPTFYYDPVWSPDSKKLAIRDKRGILWTLTLDKPTPVAVDTNRFGWPVGTPVWSPDNRWLAYTKSLRNRLNAIFCYDSENSKVHQLTDGMSDALFPEFDAAGKYLYFAASTDSGPGNLNNSIDLSAINRPQTKNLYLMVLDKNQESPLAPESDEEKQDEKKEAPAKDKSLESEKKEGASDATEKKDASSPEPEKKKNGKKKKNKNTAETAKSDATNATVKVTIDFENLSQRILALPMPSKNYQGLYAGKSNILFVLEGPDIDIPVSAQEPPAYVIHRFDLAKRKAEKFLENTKAFIPGPKKEKVLYRKGDNWYIAGADQAPKEEKAISLAGAQLSIEPLTEWKQIYNEVWRIERDFLYDPGFHGYQLEQAKKRYSHFLDGIVCRQDLNELFEEMLGELTLGHVFVGGGDMPETSRVGVGLLGADFKVDNNRYRFARIYNGENWNPKLRAPLTEPGVNVKTNEYLLAVDGRECYATNNLYAYFQGLNDRIITLKVGPNADGSKSRSVKVRTIGNDHRLRYFAWIEDNRRKVDQLSSNRLAYVYLPNTANEGYINFNRYFFPQVDREGFIIDERFNGGGLLADYVVDYLNRKILNYVAFREGEDLSSPIGANSGPKIMLINEFAGSGGDALPWYFRKLGIGPLVGKRTWGGLVGIGGYPSLIDGGYVTAPHLAIYGTEGEWEVENVGIRPDVEVEFDPKAWREGHDPQLEKAVQMALETLQKNPPAKVVRPAYPNYHKKK